MLKSIPSMKTISVFLLGASFAPLSFAGNNGHPGYAPDLLPPTSGPGECYARVEIPAQYSTSSEQVVVEEAVNRVEIYQAQLAEREEQVVVKEASVRYQVRQPTYRSTTEQMLVRPAYDKLSVRAPQFSTVTETVQTSAPRLVWKRGNPTTLQSQGYTIHSTADGGQYGQGYSSTAQYAASNGECGTVCEIWCLVEEPGQTTEFNRKVMTTPGQVVRTQVPAKYQTIHKQVISDPGGVQEITVPAEYRSVTVEDVVSPGGERVTTLPPKYAEVATQTLITPATYEWRRVICQPGTGTISSGVQHGSIIGQTTPTYSSGVVTSGYSTAPTYSAPSYSTPTYSTGETGYYNGYNDSRAQQSSTSNGNRAILGGLLGAAAGGVIGSEIAGSGSSFEGAAIGAAVGGVAGASIGSLTGNNPTDSFGSGSDYTGFENSSSYGTTSGYGNTTGWSDSQSLQNIYESGQGAARERKSW